METSNSSSFMDDLDRAPESWEAADLDESMRRLKLAISSSKNNNNNDSRSQSSSSYSAPNELLGAAPGSIERTSSDVSVGEEVISQVDQFLREALNNPRERLSVLRMEQDVEKFIRDRTQQQLEFQQLPTSYLRLAAHRVAQHYSLQSMVLLDNNMPDGSGSRIIVTKTSDCQLPLIRLADIPVNLPPEECGAAVKVAIKQRAQRRSQASNTGNSQSSKASGPKTVEERKEDYNRARARIFSSGSSTSSGKPEIDMRTQDNSQHGSFGISKAEDKYISGGSDVNIGRGSFDSPSGSSRAARTRVEKEPVVSRHKPKVAIFRDREVERNDPDYDRNYDRYLQRFDPGFGFSGGPYTMQPMYTPAVNYNTEFPQLGAVHRPQISTEHQARAHPQHLPGGPGQWIASSNHAGISYGHPEAMMTQFSPNHGGMRSTSTVYLHSSQFPCQHPGMTYIHPHEHVQPFSQSHQQQPDASYGLARPR